MENACLFGSMMKISLHFSLVVMASGYLLRYFSVTVIFGNVILIIVVENREFSYISIK